jgi:acetoin utilization deacetylase AcuC-like enzyme
MTTGFYWDERCFWHSAGEHALFFPVGGWVQPTATGGHAESPDSKRRLKSLLDVSGLTGRLKAGSAEPASVGDLLRVHERGYLDAFRALSAQDGGDLGEEGRFGKGGFEIACVSAGLAIGAVGDVLTGRLRNAYALSRPPGHHCLPGRSMGFCLLANIAIAIEAARARHGMGKVAVVDWDVHHGNGTQAIFYDRPDVLTISMHQERCYPADSGFPGERGEGAGFGANINVPLMPGGGHVSYVSAVEQIVLPALQRFCPDLIIIACGLDASGVDPLARMMASSETFRAMTRMVRGAADSLCSGRLVAVHEGGYSEVAVPFCGLAVIEELAGHRTAVEDPFLPLLTLQQPPAEFDRLEGARLQDLRRLYEL